MWQQNLLTSLRLSQMTAKRMILQAEKQAETSGEPDGVIGSIINLSSIAARHTQPQLLGYSISCAAVEQMTRSLSVALAPHRIRVNAVSFGSVLSDSLQAAIKENPDYRDAITAATPLGRIASADELAETVQYLASDASAFMTGQIITLDGGRGLIDAVNAPAH
jgi:7-alpha-hydroxysteroid dehydrogenase